MAQARLTTLLPLLLGICSAQFSGAQQADQQTSQQLLQRLAEDEARIKSLEAMVASLVAQHPANPSPVVTPAPVVLATTSTPSDAPPPAAPAPAPTMEMPASASADADHDHMMAIPDGPTLHFRGFFDVDLDKGSVAQQLQYPLGVPGNTSFRTGEFDLFMTSQLSEKLSFLTEMVFSTDPTNAFGLDLERYQLTYKQNKYFQISGGRYHTAIGYYNTAYHHGLWFSTATGRPFMYYYEDSGGQLPVHELGVTTTGAVPGSGRFDLHWVAEIGNGRADAGALFGDGVENFASDRNRKDLNFAFYTRPEWIPGLQAGGSFLTGEMAPVGLPKVLQTISSAYIVYINGQWEFLNEAVVMHHQIDGGRSFNSPMGYTQLAYRIGRYTPYFRFQEVNVPTGDPVSTFLGRYEGPSFGIRDDIFTYAALKLQYNRVYGQGTPQNGMEAQMAFTF